MWDAVAAVIVCVLLLIQELMVHKSRAWKCIDTGYTGFSPGLTRYLFSWQAFVYALLYLELHKLIYRALVRF